MGNGILLFFNFLLSFVIAILSSILVGFIISETSTHLIPMFAAGTAAVAVVKAIISLAAWVYVANEI